jgi:nitrile hydratase subunit alpha
MIDHDHGSHLSHMVLRVRALESILLEKGLVDTAALDSSLGSRVQRLQV